MEKKDPPSESVDQGTCSHRSATSVTASRVLAAAETPSLVLVGSSFARLLVSRSLEAACGSLGRIYTARRVGRPLLAAGGGIYVFRVRASPEASRPRASPLNITVVASARDLTQIDIYLSIHLSIHLSIYPSIYLSICSS